MKLRYRALGTAIERIRVEQTLRESEEKYRTLFEESRDAIVFTTREGKFVDANQSALDLFGYTKEEMLKLDVREIYANSLDRDKFLEEIEKKGYVRNYEIKYRRKGGIPMDSLLTATLRRANDGKTIEYQGIIRDITEQKEAQKILLNYQRQLRSMASRLSLSEERERRRIATYLHDGIGQTLALVKIKLGALKQSAAESKFNDAFNELFELVEQTIQLTRTLTFELSPPILYELRFEDAVEWLVERVEKQHGIQTTFLDDRRPKPLEDDIRVVLFQGVRELLLNMTKHAKATRAKVSVRKVEKTVKIEVEDDGIGFDVSKMKFHLDETGGFGLFSIRERLDHLEGNLEIESSRGHGTRVIMKAPLKNER